MKHSTRTPTKAGREEMLEQIKAYSDDLRTERYQHEVTKEKLKRNATERDALVARIDEFETWDGMVVDLLSDIRAYLVGGA